MNYALRSLIEEALSLHSGKPLPVSDYSSVSGGSINEAYRIETAIGLFFVKTNDAAKYPGMFEAEKKGLKLLKENSKLKIPECITVAGNENDSIIILEYIESGMKDQNSWHLFAQQLAQLHRKTNDRFGLDHDNYIGSLKQSNFFHSSWAEFYIEERLSKQLKMAYDDKKISSRLLRSFDKLYQRLPDLFPVEHPSLLHGDLWSGNYMVTSEKQPCIYDPAVYYGHREMDIAMTRLFGGFPDEFYKAYNEHFPMEKKWEERMSLCNLYPLLVHVNLFGGGYVRELEIIVKRLV
jgi:fructosamine-3-kinase